MADHRFGVSTHLFHESRLTREHLVHIAAHGFDAIELFATRSHFDYHDDQAIDRLAEWLSDTRLELHSMHAPIFEAHQERPVGRLVLERVRRREAPRRRHRGDARGARRSRAVSPTAFWSCISGCRPKQGDACVAPQDNQPDAARRSLEDIVVLAAEVGVRVAVEVIPNPLSSAAALVRLIEDELEGIDVGICLDYGHAHLMGDLGEAIETLSGHLWTTHVHDNGGRRDDHLVPFAGTIDWDAAMMETQKIGYDGVLMFEVADTGDPVDVLRRSVKARERLEKTFVTF